MRRAHLLITLAVFTAVSLWIVRSPLFGVFDSLIHWGAIQVFLRGGDPYNFEALGQALSGKMNHVPLSQRIGAHPWTLTFMFPFYVWPFPIAKFLLAFTNLSVYYFCILRLRKIWPPLPTFFSLIMWGYIPFLATMYFGQFSIFLLLGMVLLIDWFQSSDRPWWKWVFAMALLAIKPQGFLVATPLLMMEFVRSSTSKDWLKATGVGLLMLVLSSPLLAYTPEWIVSSAFSHQLRTATLSSYVRDIGAFLGYDTSIWLWALPIASLVTLLALGVRITGVTSLLLIVTLSQLTAPYIWVYDACALMPLFYALLGAAVMMEEPRWRRYLGIGFASVAIFPIYLAVDSDFSFMLMHNVCMGISAVLLLPGLQGYLGRCRT